MESSDCTLSITLFKDAKFNSSRKKHEFDSKILTEILYTNFDCCEGSLHGIVMVLRSSRANITMP